MTINPRELDAIFDDAVAAVFATVLVMTLAGLFGHPRAFGVYVLSGMTFDGAPALVLALQVAGISGCVALSLLSIALTIRVICSVAHLPLWSNRERQEEQEKEARQDATDSQRNDHEDRCVQ